MDRNSIIDAHTEFFEGKVLLSAPCMADICGIGWKMSSEESEERRLNYLKVCDQFVADQQRELWDKKLSNETSI